MELERSDRMLGAVEIALSLLHSPTLLSSRHVSQSWCIVGQCTQFSFKTRLTDMNNHTLEILSADPGVC